MNEKDGSSFALPPTLLQSYGITTATPEGKTRRGGPETFERAQLRELVLDVSVGWTCENQYTTRRKRP